MTKLHDLYEQQGQSPWIDNISRDSLREGKLAGLVSDGIRGVTSNPTIFAHAIESGTNYDEQFADLLSSHSIEEAYWALVISDIVEALGVLRPVYDSSGTEDGFVSIEVAPSLAHDTKGSASEARRLHEEISRPNLFVKIPGTAEGIAAIRTMFAEGRSINITLLFSLERYTDVVEAYMAGLEDLVASGDSDLSRVHSVASFFVSRVDTEVDRRLGEIEEQADGPTRTKVSALKGKAAVAQARMAYELFKTRFRGARWEALAAKGARVQRPLWASTSTKNPAYPDLVYVDSLIGPDTVNTMPDQTVAAFMDHGTPSRTVDADPAEASRVLEELGDIGIDMSDVARTLEDEGVATFTKSFEEVLQVLTDKANALSAKRLESS